MILINKNCLIALALYSTCIIINFVPNHLHHFLMSIGLTVLKLFFSFFNILKSLF